MSDDTGSDDFATNLRYLSSYYRSISDVCRRLGINRTQFNKYLSGDSRPSRFVMRRLCDFFGLDEYEIIQPHEALVRLMAVREKKQQKMPELFTALDRISDMRKIQEYCGFYICFKISMRNASVVLRSMMRIGRKDNFFSVNYIERGDYMKQRFLGQANFIQERLFITAADSLYGAELLSMVFFPAMNRRVGILSGLCTGTITNNTRPPSCVRIVMQKLPSGFDIRKELAGISRVTPQNSSSIPPAIRALLIAPSPVSGQLTALSV